MRCADATAADGRSPAPILSPAMIVLMLRLDARRAASWLGLGCALVCGFGGATSEAALPAVVAAGGLAAVAAIGHVPARRLVASGPRGGAWLEQFLTGMRASWPVAGFLLAAAGPAARGISVAAPLAGSVSASGTGVLFAMLLRAGCAETVAASLALVGAGGAAGAALAAQRAGSGVLGQAFAAVVAWGIVAATAVAGQANASPVGFGPAADAGRHRPASAGTGPAMASALLAMVACYFLAPQFAWAYAAVAVGWFVAVAVPPATAAAGSTAAVRLGRSAAGRPALPGSFRRAVRGTATMAGLLVWPAVVALVLPAVEGGRVGGPLVALAWLAGVVAVLTLAVAIALPVGRAEAARAVVLSLVAIAGVGAARGVARLPGFPGFSPPQAGQPAGSGVEPLEASCKTSHLPQPARSRSQTALFVELAAPGAR